MKKFKFNLESVLQIREFEEESIKQELAAINKKVNEYENKIDEYFSILDNEYEKPKSTFNVSSYLHQNMYINCLNKNISEEKRNLELTKKEMMQCQDKVTKAHQETQVLVTLKEKKYNAYRKENDRIEQNLMDDLGTTSFLRNKLDSKVL